MIFEATSRKRAKSFEDEPVQVYTLVIPGKTMDLDIPLLLHEKIEITFTAQVQGVHHDVDGRTGQLKRQHKIVIDATEVRPL